MYIMFPEFDRDFTSSYYDLDFTSCHDHHDLDDEYRQDTSYDALASRHHV